MYPLCIWGAHDVITNDLSDGQTAAKTLNKTSVESSCCRSKHGLLLLDPFVVVDILSILYKPLFWLLALAF